MDAEINEEDIPPEKLAEEYKDGQANSRLGVGGKPTVKLKDTNMNNYLPFPQTDISRMSRKTKICSNTSTSSLTCYLSSSSELLNL